MLIINFFLQLNNSKMIGGGAKGIHNGCLSPLLLTFLYTMEQYSSDGFTVVERRSSTCSSQQILATLTLGVPP